MDSLEPIKRKIYEIRGRRVMLDSDLAEMYQVETKNLKRAVRANIERFPDDFMFELTKEEYDSLRCNNFTLNNVGDSLRCTKEVVIAIFHLSLHAKALPCFLDC